MKIEKKNDDGSLELNKDGHLLLLDKSTVDCLTAIPFFAGQEVFKRTGTVILVVSIIVWTLSYFPRGNINDSIFVRIGIGLEPFSKLMGLSWQPMVALLTSFVAKENTIASLGVLLGGQNVGLSQALRKY